MAQWVAEVDEAMKSDAMKPIAAGSTQVSLGIHQAIINSGPLRKVFDFLHGTWLGHPLHPILTDITIGAWSLGALFDLIGWVNDSDDARKTADQLTAIGTASAVPTAITGIVDYSTFPEPSATPVTLHAVTNIINFGLYVASVRDRRNGRRGRGVLLSTIGFMLTGFSSWLGGELVFRYQVGVDHSDDFDGPANWTPIMLEKNLPQRLPIQANFGGKGIMLYREENRVSAIGALCSHAGAPLQEGKVKGNCVTCPWHDSVFDIRTGAIVHGPATQPQPAFKARIHGEQVEIKLINS